MLTSLVTIARTSLTSRTVRSAVTAGNGRRTISQRDPGSLSPGGLLGFLGSLFNHLLTFSGWLISGILGGISFSFSSAWSYITQSALQLYYFNWNISDQQIDQLLEQQKAILAGMAGSTAGNLLGYLVCGIAPSAVILAFNEPLGAYLLKEVGEEALDEFLANFRALLQASARMGSQRAGYEMFKNIRRNVRELVKNPDSTASQAVKSLFGNEVLKALQGWGTTNKPWSFASAIEEKIESLNDPVAENFWENFVDDFIDACIEAGYVIAGGLDSWVAQQRLTQNDSQFGQETIVEILPNREVDGERIVLAAPRDLLRQEIVSTMRTHELLDNRNVGMWVGEPVSELVRVAPTSLDLRIIFNSVQRSPFIQADGKRGKQVQVTIPNVDRAKIDWSAIKAAAGGDNGYLWGRFLGRATLDNEQFVYAYCATSDEAKDRVKAYAAFSKSELLAITITEETREGKRAIYNALYKEPTRIYPISFTIINQQRILNEASGKATLSGIYKRKQDVIPLNVPSQPNDFDTIIADLFRIPGATP